ncbi:hypothetical protein DSO57_1018958 [Entomophthora muscae]|uniref:Uncharacterized protein n=1 Tax=Entomophthora muscae TaxID=34485 RepID=A0ACC2STT3_9FUNG|nr:hypothetical protein DSO57_1018958 [Entomophthora muscae]
MQPYLDLTLDAKQAALNSRGEEAFSPRSVQEKLGPQIRGSTVLDPIWPSKSRKKSESTQICLPQPNPHAMDGSSLTWIICPHKGKNQGAQTKKDPLKDYTGINQAIAQKWVVSKQVNISTKASKSCSKTENIEISHIFCNFKWHTEKVYPDDKAIQS